MATDTTQKQEARLRGAAKVDFTTPLHTSVLENKTAIITGGASGIGLGIAAALSQYGVRVGILDINEEAGLRAQRDLSIAGGGTVKYFHTDVTSWDSQLAAFKEVLAWSGNTLDIVIPSAGVRSHNMRDLVYDQLADLTRDPTRPPTTTFDVNLRGTYYTTYLALTYLTRFASQPSSMEREFKPQLLFMSSLAGYAEQSLSADYAATKYGVRGMWKAIRSQGKLFGGCQANLLAPGFVHTDAGAGKEEREEKHGIVGVKAAKTEDVVEGAVRCVCDGGVEGMFFSILLFFGPGGLARTRKVWLTVIDG